MGFGLNDRFHSFDQTDWHLQNWAAWMRTGGFSSLAYQISEGHKGSTTFDEMVENADRIAARAVDAILGNLPPAQQCAVHHVWLGASWRFPRNNVDALLELAKMAVRRGLSERGIY